MSPTNVAPMLEATRISRAFGGTPVVREVSLDVRPGEIVALVGPNGSGKTTLMLMLATLLAPDSGTVRIGGNDAATATAAARALLGWMPDALGSWPALTVRETLVAVCGMYGITGRTAATRTDELLELTGLASLASQRTHTLSRGQKQRLSLARAVARSPSLLLLDEPAAGLDPEARVAQRSMLQHLAAQGTAILITSHVLDELDELATRVVFLREGRAEPAETVEAAMRQRGLWRVRSLDPSHLEAALAELGIAAQTQNSLAGTSQIVELADENAAAALLGTLVSRGASVVEFTPAASGLETAFVRLTGEETEETA
ncbi:MAG: ABC transporter ATP-binding protein [Leucobacter sp.]